MRLVDVNIRAAGPTVRMTGRVERAGGAVVEPYVEYEVDPEFVGAAPEVFAAAMLLPAMRAGEALRIDAPISPRLAVMLPRIRDVFHTWWPDLSRIDIDLTPAAAGAPAPPPDRAATFFSGGVDSFYTFLKHHRGHGTLPAPMTHVIFMRGTETRLERQRGVDETEKGVREMAARMGAQLIVGETNFRSVLQGPEQTLSWERHYYGSALAAIALGLSPGLAFICIPAGYSYNHLLAFGSTPLVDEMFSTERLLVLHDGAEANRAMKVGRIVEWDRDLVAQHLRVCLENRGGASNCGRCKKCVRTAVPLRVLGVWNDAALFTDKSTDHWERAMAQDYLVLTEENLAFAQAHGGDPELVSMLQRVIRRKRRREIIKRVLDRPPVDRLQPAVLRMRDYWYAATR